MFLGEIFSQYTEKIFISNTNFNSRMCAPFLLVVCYITKLLSSQFILYLWLDKISLLFYMKSKIFTILEFRQGLSTKENIETIYYFFTPILLICGYRF